MRVMGANFLMTIPVICKVITGLSLFGEPQVSYLTIDMGTVPKGMVKLVVV